MSSKRKEYLVVCRAAKAAKFFLVFESHIDPETRVKISAAMMAKGYLDGESKHRMLQMQVCQEVKKIRGIGSPQSSRGSGCSHNSLIDSLPLLVVSLSPSQISSSSSRFYPLLINLIERGEAAWTAAAHLLGPVGEGLARPVNTAALVVALLGTLLVAGVAAGIVNATPPPEQLLPLLPQAKEVMRVYNMLRNEDVQLRELVKEGIPSGTKWALVGMGIKLDKNNKGDRGGGKEDDSGLSSLLLPSSMSIGAARLMWRRIDKLQRVALTSLEEIITRTKSTAGDAFPPNALSLMMTTTSIAMAEEARRQFVDAFDGLLRASTSDLQLSKIFASILD
jgi:hypothetical protein